ncbi:MAG: hypothetical protein WC058_06140 [Phycisphaeraceae bacterium]
MKWTLVACGMALAITGSVNAAPIVGELVGVFDPPGDDTISAYAGSLTVADLTNWKTTVATAFTNETGAVWNSGLTTPLKPDGTSPFVSQLFGADGAELPYGTSKVLTLKNVGAADWSINMFSSANRTSGFAHLDPNTVTAATTALSLTLSGGGLATGEYVNAVALALNGRSGAVGIVTFTATFSDNSTQALAFGGPLAFGTSGFVLFNAPAGLGITQIQYSSTTTRQNPIDDFSFTTAIPEPATLGLMAISGLLMAGRGKR